MAPGPSGGSRGLRAVFVATGLTAFGPLPAFMLGGFAVLVRDELRFTEAALGVAIAVFFAFAAAGSAPAGRLADRLGARRALQIGLAATAAALATMTLAPNWWQLTVGLAVAGAGHAILQVASNLLLANDVAPDIQGVAFGIKQSAIPLATLIAGAAVPLVGTEYGWRPAYAAAAVSAIFVLSLHGRFGRRRSGGRSHLPATRVPRQFSRAQLRGLAVAVAFGAASANALAAFLVEYAVSVGMPVGRAGVLLAVVSALGLIARIGIGRLADIRHSADLAAVAGMLGVGAVAFAVLPTAGAQSPVLWVAAAAGFAGGWGWPGLFTFIVAHTNATAPATATGVTQTGVFAGAVAGPLLFGLAVSTMSYTVAWSGAAIAQVIGAVLILIVRRHWKRSIDHI